MSKKNLAFIQPWIKDYVLEAKEYYSREYSDSPWGRNTNRSKTLRYFDMLKKLIEGEDVYKLCLNYNITESNLITQARSAHQRVLLYLNLRDR